jgi:hypothetical protein
MRWRIGACAWAKISQGSSINMDGWPDRKCESSGRLGRLDGSDRCPRRAIGDLLPAVCVYVCVCTNVCTYACCLSVCVSVCVYVCVLFVEGGESSRVVQGVGLANLLLSAYRPGDDLFTHVSFFTCQRLAPSGVFHQQVFHAYQLQLHMGYLPLRGTAVFATFSTGKAPLFATRVGMFHDMFV